MPKLMIGAVGDISFARALNDLIGEKGPSYPFEKVLDLLKKQDVLFGSLESVFIPPNAPKSKLNPYFKALNSFSHTKDSLKFVKFDLLNQATNHALDFGSKGLLYTYDCIKKAGALPIGVGKHKNSAYSMKVVKKKGLRIGFLAYTDPFRWTLKGGSGRIAYFNENKAIADIRKNKPKVDLLVVSLHSDLEFTKAPSLSRMNSCRRMAKEGADIILCHHPHVPQGVEMYNNSLIVYSLGNFVFDIGPYQRKHNPLDTLKSHILLIEIKNKKIVGWKREFLKINPKEHRPHPITNKKELKTTKAYYQMLDQLLKNKEKVRQEWHKTCQYWLNEFWKEIVKQKPNTFIKNFGWFFLNCYPHLLAGIKDMADKEFEKHAYKDFKYYRPYFPFEKKK